MKIHHLMPLLLVLVAGCRSPVPAPPTAGNQAPVAAIDTCPSCESAAHLPIIYGRLDAKGEALVLDGKAVSGGCGIARGMPWRSCCDCGHIW
tara:strand:+ start:114 stop:389 length:276 start_codon:yes stop_codon:yes gene_type:complete